MNTQTKHTPGPWIWSRQVRGVGSWLEQKKPRTRMWSIHTEDGEGIAYIGPLAHLHKNIISKTEANARLISAAPDLLEAAESTVDDYETNDIESLKHSIGNLLAAIAQAKGKHENQTS